MKFFVALRKQFEDYANKSYHVFEVIVVLHFGHQIIRISWENGPYDIVSSINWSLILKLTLIGLLRIHEMAKSQNSVINQQVIYHCGEFENYFGSNIPF